MASVLNQIYMIVQQECFVLRRWKNITSSPPTPSSPLLTYIPQKSEYLETIQDINTTYYGLTEMNAVITANSFITEERKSKTFRSVQGNSNFSWQPEHSGEEQFLAHH